MLDDFCIAGAKFKDTVYHYENEEYYPLDEVLYKGLPFLNHFKDLNSLNKKELAQRLDLDSFCFHFGHSPIYLFYLKKIYKGKLEMLENIARSYLNEFLMKFYSYIEMPKEALSLDFAIFAPFKIAINLKQNKENIEFLYSSKFEESIENFINEDREYFNEFKKIFEEKFKLFVRYKITFAIKNAKRKLEHKEKGLKRDYEAIILKENYQDFLKFQAFKALKQEQMQSFFAPKRKINFTLRDEYETFIKDTNQNLQCEACGAKLTKKTRFKFQNKVLCLRCKNLKTHEELNKERDRERKKPNEEFRKWTKRMNENFRNFQKQSEEKFKDFHKKVNTWMIAECKECGKKDKVNVFSFEVNSSVNKGYLCSNCFRLSVRKRLGIL